MAAVLALASAAALAGASGCSVHKPTGQGASITRTAKVGEGLAGKCPPTVVLQTDWYPADEYGAVWKLLGGKPEWDDSHKTITAKLVAHGVDTGVKLQIRSGGEVVGFRTPLDLAYHDDSITLAGADLDQVWKNSKTYPMQAVFAPMDVSPIVLMWDPKRYPTIHTITDIRKHPQVKVRVLKTATYPDFLVPGVLLPSQIDRSYTGDSSPWMADKGKEIQQGYLTNEVYAYQYLYPQWHKPVRWVLVGGNYNGAYRNYQEAFTIREDRKAELAPCLKLLIPDLQQATVDYMHDPDPTNQLIRDARDHFQAPGLYPKELQDAGVKVMRSAGIIGNGPNNVVGDFDPARVNTLFTQVIKDFQTKRVPLAPGLKPDQTYTNEYLAKIGLN
ncbi:MAG: hypothetical protein ACJ73S_03685 [Mycobacteriales bacterium]